MTADRDRALIAVTREHAKNIVQARSGWGAAGDLDHLNEARIIADAERKMRDGTLPKRERVSDWRDDARQPMQVIMMTASTIKETVERGMTGPDLAESVALLERNIDRLDRALAVLDAAFPEIGDAPLDSDDLKRLAVAVRDQCRHAAICAPVHVERPEDVIDRINLDQIIKQAVGDEWGEIAP